MRRFLSSVCEEAYQRGHCPVMWATPGGHYDRSTCKMYDQVLREKLYAIGGKPFAPQTMQNDYPGDVNADNAVTAADAVLLQRYLLGEDVLTELRGDLNADGRLNAKDLTLLKRMLLNT